MVQELFSFRFSLQGSELDRRSLFSQKIVIAQRRRLASFDCEARPWASLSERVSTKFPHMDDLIGQSGVLHGGSSLTSPRPREWT